MTCPREWSDDDGESRLNLAEAEAEISGGRKRRNPAQLPRLLGNLLLVRTDELEPGGTCGIPVALLLLSISSAMASHFLPCVCFVWGGS